MLNANVKVLAAVRKLRSLHRQAVVLKLKENRFKIKSVVSKHNLIKSKINNTT